MKLSTRLTRAGAAFIVFGLVASVLPTNTAVLAANLYPPPPPPPSTGGRSNHTAEIVAGVVVIGGLTYLALEGGKLFPYAAGKKKKKRNYQEEQFNKLDRFTRPTDAGSNPGLNH